MNCLSLAGKDRMDGAEISHDLIDVGHVVRIRRAELGLSQASLTQLSRLSRQTLVGLENGALRPLHGLWR